MSAAIQFVQDPEKPALEPTPGLHFVVRQPILDSRGRVHAYELRFREPSNLNGIERYMNLLETAASFGLERPSELKKLTGRLTAFVRCPLEALSEQLAQVLPASLTVLEIMPILEVPPELLVTCRRIKALGFRFALDDFKVEMPASPLDELADYIKVDFAQVRPRTRRELLNRWQGNEIAIIAKGIDSHADYRRSRDEGFTLFQGFYFREPHDVRDRRPKVNQMLRLNILKALQASPMDMHKLSQLVMRDGPITYQLLRLVNSPLWGMRQKVESIEVALVAVGEDAFRRIAMLAIAAEFNGDQPAELLSLAILRGRICEVMAAKRGLDPFGQYLLGLLSLLPAMQGQPMSEVTRTLPLAEEIIDALTGKRNAERAVLGWLENCERCDWARCDAAAVTDGLDQRELANVYVDAVDWTEKAVLSGV